MVVNGGGGVPRIEAEGAPVTRMAASTSGTSSGRPRQPLVQAVEARGSAVTQGLPGGQADPRPAAPRCVPRPPPPGREPPPLSLRRRGPGGTFSANCAHAQPTGSWSPEVAGWTEARRSQCSALAASPRSQSITPSWRPGQEKPGRTRAARVTRPLGRMARAEQGPNSLEQPALHLLGGGAQDDAHSRSALQLGCPAGYFSSGSRLQLIGQPGVHPIGGGYPMGQH